MYSKGSGNQWKVLSRSFGSGSDFRKEQLLVAAVWREGRRGAGEEARRTAQVSRVETVVSGLWCWQRMGSGC